MAIATPDVRKDSGGKAATNPVTVRMMHLAGCRTDTATPDVRTDSGETDVTMNVIARLVTASQENVLLKVSSNVIKRVILIIRHMFNLLSKNQWRHKKDTFTMSISLMFHSNNDNNNHNNTNSNSNNDHNRRAEYLHRRSCYWTHSWHGRAHHHSNHCGHGREPQVQKVIGKSYSYLKSCFLLKCYEILPCNRRMIISHSCKSYKMNCHAKLESYEVAVKIRLRYE